MKNKIFLTISLLAAVFVITSCLKDKIGEDWTASLKGKMYAEIWNAGFAAFPLQPVPDTADFRFLVNIATDQPPTQDITITLAVDEAALTAYNDLKGTNYLLYPYILVQPLTIKAGTRNAYAHVKVWNADKLNACDNFMAPIVISAATGGVIPADPLNNGARFMALPISNPYSGDYHVVGYRKHPSLGFFDVDRVESLTTVDCKTVTKGLFGDYPYNVQIEITTNTMDVLGVTCYKVNVTVIDPGTNAPVASGQGQYATFTGDDTHIPIPISNDVNYYNPVTKQFVLNAYYNSAANRLMYEVLTRL
jgi:hypothetical protein